MRLSLVSVVALLCVACGGDDEPPAAVPVAELCTKWVAAICAAADRCGCGAVIPEVGTDCPAAAAPLCPLAEGTALRAGVEDGSVAYDPAAAGTLLAEIEAIACDAAAPCALGQCIGLSAEGGPCGPNVGCASGLSCIDGRCARPAPEGAPCSAPAGCASGRCAEGRCAPEAEDGSACAEDVSCASGRCDFSTGRCAAPAPSGELCADHFDCASGYCDRDLELGAGTCRDRVPDGGACDEDPQCLGGACIDLVCTAAVCDELG